MSVKDKSSVNILIKNAWYAVGLSADFEVEKLERRVLCEKVLVLWRTTEGEVVAHDDRCCHKRMPISAGRFLEGGVVECPYHGFCFDSKGACVRIPSLPDGPIPKRARLISFEVREKDGIVWVWPGDKTKIGNIEPIDTPEVSSPDWDTIHGEIIVKGNSVLMIENVLDLTHFYPLHGNSIGQYSDTQIDFEVETGEISGSRFTRSSRDVENYPQSDSFIDLLTHKVADGTSSQTMIGPGVLIATRTLWPAGGRAENKDPKSLINYHLFTPHDRKSHKYTYIVNMPKGQMCSSDPKKRGVDRAKELFPSVFDEDIWAIEMQQKSCEIEDDEYQEVNVASDLALMRGRKILFDLYEKEA